MIKEFREFIMRGDVLDLAVGVVIRSAFTSIVNQVVQVNHSANWLDCRYDHRNF